MVTHTHTHTHPQIGVLLIYLAFITWALWELVQKVRELKYMKIANHLKAVYVPNMSITHASRQQLQKKKEKQRKEQQQRQQQQQQDQKKGVRRKSVGGAVAAPAAADGGGRAAGRGGRRGSTADAKSHAHFWALFRYRSSSNTASEEGEEEEEDEEQEEEDDLPSSTAPASYPTRQFPFYFLLLETSLLFFCLYLLLKGGNSDLVCYIVPTLNASLPPSLASWAQATYQSLLQSSSSRRRSATQMCFAYWPCAIPSLNPFLPPTLVPFLLRFQQSKARTLLDIIMETGIFASTAYTLTRLLQKSYFFIDIERYMDPAFEPPYKNIHEHRYVCFYSLYFAFLGVKMEK